MSRELYLRVKRLFLEARAKPPDQRRAFLDECCDDDPEVRREVESLLAHLGPGEGDAPAPERLGNYRLLRRIGEGGMGVVWEARQERPLRRRVALKVLRPELVSDEILARFEAERQTLALMEHPNIATVFDAGAGTDGRPFFAMEYVDGKPITDYCREYRLDTRARLRLFVDVCRGVAHAHRRGVLHRDLKPSNLLVAQVDGKPVPKVIDFGVAKAIGDASERLTRTGAPGAFIGTPDYVSPEQAAGSGTLDTRSDVYSLGIVLYELLTGAHPREHSAAGAPPPPSAHAPREIHGALDRITLAALARERDRRYGSPAELADDIERFLSGAGVAAPTAQRRLRAMALAAATLAVVVLAVLALVVRERPALAPGEPSPATTTDAYDAFLRGREKLRGGSPEDLVQARALFESSLESEPAFAPALTGLAESKLLLARRGDLPMEIADAEAGAALQRALTLQPEHAEAHAVLGLLRILIGDLDGAEVSLRRAIELDDNLAVAHLRLATVLAARGGEEEAAAAYRRAVELDPLNRDVNLSTARNLMNSGRYEEGLLRFRHWLRVQPDSAETYRLMSMYARTYGKLDDAVEWALRAVELDPEAPLNVHELEMAYSNLGEFEKAARWMEHAYRLAPNNHWTFTLKAFQLIESGEFDELDRFLAGELARNPPPEVDPLPQIARVRLALAARAAAYNGDFQRAAELSERALGQPMTSILEIGFDADVLAFLAYAYQQLGRPEEARPVIEECQQLLLGQPRSWTQDKLILSDTLAATYAMQGRPEEAMATLEAAVDAGWSLLSVLNYSPLFESLRDREDYRALTRRVTRRVAEMRERVRDRRGAKELARPPPATTG